MKKRRWAAHLLFAMSFFFPWMAESGDRLPLLKLSDPCLVRFLAAAKPLIVTLPSRHFYLVVHLAHETTPKCRKFPTMGETLYLALYETSFFLNRTVVAAPLAQKPSVIRLTEMNADTFPMRNVNKYFQIDVVEKNKKNATTVRQIFFNFADAFMKIKDHPDPAAVIPLDLRYDNDFTRFYTMTRFKNIPDPHVSIRQFQDMEDRECAGMPYRCPRFRRCLAIAAKNGKDAVYCLPWAYEWTKLKLIDGGDITQPGGWLTFQATEAYAPDLKTEREKTRWRGLYSKRKRTFSFNLEEGFIDAPPSQVAVTPKER